jgi:amino acid transporter
MKTTALALVVVVLLILLGVFWVGDDSSAEAASWVGTFSLVALVLLAVSGAGYFVAKGQSKSEKFRRLFFLLLALGALIILGLLMVIGAAIGEGLGGQDGQGMFGLLLFPR